MRVRITYGIDIDEIPDVLISEIKGSLKTLSEEAIRLKESAVMFGSVLSLPNGAVAVSADSLEEELGSFIELLSKTEQRLTDMKAILSGFSGVIRSEGLPPIEPASVGGGGNPRPAEASDHTDEQ